MTRSKFIPLFVFGLLVVFLGRGLTLNARELPSALVGQAAPAFQLAQIDASQPDFSPASLKGQVWVLNVWASWCGPCRTELPAVQVIARTAPVVGLNYKDQRQKGAEWLGKYGNPFAHTALDATGKVGIDYGITGVPETFIIDKKGVVRFRHSGPISNEAVRDQLLPLIRELQRG